MRDVRIVLLLSEVYYIIILWQKRRWGSATGNASSYFRPRLSSARGRPASEQAKASERARMESPASSPELKLDSFFLESSYPFVPHFTQFFTSSRNSTTASPTPTPPARPHPHTTANCNNRLYGLVHVPSEQCPHLPTSTTPRVYRRRANSAYSDDSLSANPNIDIHNKLISAEELLKAHKLALRLLLRIADNPGTRGGGDPEGEGEATPTRQPPTESSVLSVPAPLPTISFPAPQTYQHVSFDELDTLTGALQDFTALLLELSTVGSFDEKSSDAFSRLSRWFAEQVDPISQPGQWRSSLQSALRTSRRMLDAYKSASPHSVTLIRNQLLILNSGGSATCRPNEYCPAARGRATE